ncbi:unnamed protein product [Meganyctiphanes norvegica]|uniref:HTH CENPB-type domain-containing protein n=1 Tax=Meganyctiphanes norvegica TaxID=48144 RepID=A0AAV2Q404_MEGNR
MSSSQNKYTLDQKLEILEMIENRGSKSLAEVGKRLKLTDNAVKHIWRHRERTRMLEQARKNGTLDEVLNKKKPPQKKLTNGSTGQNLEGSLVEWYEDSCFDGVPVNDARMAIKAQDIANQMNLQITITSQWVKEFKSRHGIVLRGDPIPSDYTECDVSEHDSGSEMNPPSLDDAMDALHVLKQYFEAEGLTDPNLLGQEIAKMLLAKDK